MQIGDPVVLKVIETIGVPATVVLGLYVYDRFVLRKRSNGNGGISELTLVKMLDQLRRDMEARIKEEAVETRKDVRNALTAYIIERTEGRPR